jgi:uncharacterized protein (DUF1697 family)
MHQYIAFLRGMNLGKRRISMDQLRASFEELKFRDVATFIASGNVLFRSSSADAHTLESKIESHLEKRLGYSVDTFVRTRAELAAVAAFHPFPREEPLAAASTLHVGFMKEKPSAASVRAMMQSETEVDHFRVEGREIYWLCYIKTHESKVWNSPTMKAAKIPTITMRNMTTIRKLAALSEG